MSDEVVSEKQVIKNTYMSRKGQTFEELKQDPSDWQPAEISGFIPDGKGKDIPVYHIGSIKVTVVPKAYKTTDKKTGKEVWCEGRHVEYIHDKDDYTHVETRYSEGSEAHNKLVEYQKINEGSNIQVPTTLCELCGHGIKYVHILINYKTKQYMKVGSVCIHRHYGKVVRETIKRFKMNEIRTEFSRLRDQILPLLETQLDLEQSHSREHRAYVIRNKRLKYWAYKLKKELLSIDPETTGSRKLKNRINTMNESFDKIEDMSNIIDKAVSTEKEWWG